jgi:Tfp pilus assembly protein PilF
LGAAQFEAGTLPESRHNLDESLTLDPQTLTAYFWRAQLFARQNDPAKAISDLEVFVALDANYPEAYKSLTQLYTAEKQPAKASNAQAKYDSLAKKTGAPHIPLFLQQLGMIHFLEARGMTE